MKRHLSLAAMCAFWIGGPALPADDAPLLKELQAMYDSQIRAQAAAKTPAEIDANERLMDTADWVSIVNDGPAQHWADLRGGLIATIGQPQDVAVKILKVTASGDQAVVIARVGGIKDVAGQGDLSRTMLIRDTWVKTSAGWRRKMHEKPAPGKLDSEVK